jgi:AcrB/AcrD/AcrF family
LAGLRIDRAELIAALQAQNAITPAGVVQTADEKILVRVSGAFRSEKDVLAVNFIAKNGRIIRLGDIARVTRGPADPAQPMFRVNGRDGIGLAIAMRTGGDVLALGRNIEQAMTEITANPPVGIEPTLVADQPVTVEHAVDEFMEALWEAVAIVLAVSLVSLGLRAGATVAIAIPLVLDPARNAGRYLPCRRYKQRSVRRRNVGGSHGAARNPGSRGATTTAATGSTRAAAAAILSRGLLLLPSQRLLLPASRPLGPNTLRSISGRSPPCLRTDLWRPSSAADGW